jgi:hypothetical protein
MINIAMREKEEEEKKEKKEHLSFFNAKYA